MPAEKRAAVFLFFSFLLIWAGYQELGPPEGSARLEVVTEPRMPVRIYAWKGNSEFRLAPVDAVLPIKSDLFYRDRLWTASPNPKVMEVIAADKYHYVLLEGTATFHLPPGQYRMEAYRGHFYRPAEVQFELKPGEQRRLVLPMNAWANPDQWISSDDHIHLTRSLKENPVFLRWMAAEDLTVGNFLQLQRQVQAAVQYAFGKAGEAREGRYVIRPGHESRNEFWGHINLLGGERMIAPLSTGTMYANTPECYPYPSILFAEGRKAGATVGYAHWFQAPQHSTIYMDAALGNIDFVEVFQFGVLKIEPWYELLNAGARFTGIAGSDFPVPLNRAANWPHWVPLLGPERALVKGRGGPDSYQDWARGVREGRVIVTNGPLVEISVDERTGRAEATASFYRPLESIEIVRNGVVVGRTAGDGKAERLSVSIQTDKKESFWLAARASAQKKQGEPDLQAHTNPVYVLKDGAPVRVAESRKAVSDKWEKQLAFYRSATIPFPDEEKRRQFFSLAEKALAALRD